MQTDKGNSLTPTGISMKVAKCEELKLSSETGESLRRKGGWIMDKANGFGVFQSESMKYEGEW